MGKCEHGLTARVCYTCASPKYGTETVEKAAAELRRLHAENVDLKQTSAEHCPECGWRMLVPADGCRNCECAELRRDAERYRWLRDVHANHFTVTRHVGGGTIPRFHGLELDEVLDAAMKDEKK